MAATLQLPATSAAALRRALQRQGMGVATSVLDRALDAVQTGLLDLFNPREVVRDGVKVTEGFNPASAKEWIDRQFAKLSPEGLQAAGFVEQAIKISTEVAQGAGRYVAQNADAEAVAEYPAWEFKRVYDRDVPRGDSGHQGDDDWPTRWQAAAQASGDDDAARIERETGRMVALKASPIWAALGTGAGGYQDTLGNPFPPFAFNSGFDCDEVHRTDCEELGLPVSNVQPADVDLENLFAPIP